MKEKALLVIDVQHGFMQQGAEIVVPRIRDLVGAWPEDDIFYLCYRNYPGSFFSKNLDWTECMTGEAVAIVPDVYKKGRPVFEHYGYKPPEGAMQALRQYQSVHICGVDTDACLMAAVFALWDAEIRPVVLEHYCASSGGPHFHQVAVDLMLRQFGTGCIVRGQVAG